MPVGVFTGGLYMFWPILAGSIVRRPGSTLATCLIQAVLALVTGFTGLLGPAACISYVTPGVVMEVLFHVARRIRPDGVDRVVTLMLAGMLGNLAGSMTNAYLFFALRGHALTVAITSSLVSGAGGGWLACVVGKRLAGFKRADERSLA